MDYFEIDFLEVHSSKSGDAISIRYTINDLVYVHVVDGGYASTGETLVEHIKTYYGDIKFIDNVVVTHNDSDHACGIRSILENYTVGTLWMLRPWEYAEEIIDRFETYNSVDHLKRRLKKVYPNLADIESVALEKGVNILEPFQGAMIGAFTVLSPSRHRYLDLVVNSEKTPQAVEAAAESIVTEALGFLYETAKKAVNLLKSAWGEEVFSSEETSAENEMSIVQYANLCGKSIVLTGDVGRAGLAEAADCAIYYGLCLPGVDYFQIPHHGSRRNVSTEVLDRWFGERLDSMPEEGTEEWTAIVSAAKEDSHHPRKSVIRAFRHRGGRVLSTDDGKGTKRISRNAPSREGWTAAVPLPYPEEQEEA